MSADPSQLDEIYTQLRDYFVSHPVISIRPAKGDPPERYEITYAMAGISKSAEGEIVETSSHRVELVIPFGFPHFPPSCKPVSDIFHPDFDPAAICLGDFWDQDSSLTDLIIHIGKLINGEFYSINNAFNEGAASWYQENAARFPLASINWLQLNDLKSTGKKHLHLIDTLDEPDLVTELGSLSLEKEEEEIVLDTAFPEVDSPPPVNLESFEQLANQKKFYTLLRKIGNSGTSSNESAKLCEKAGKAVERAEKLHRDAKQLENRGEAGQALEKYQQVAGIAADFPAINIDIQRVGPTLSPPDHLHLDSTPDTVTADIFSLEETSQAPEETGPDDQSKISEKARTPRRKTVKTLQQSMSGRNKRAWLLPLTALLAIGFLGGGTGYIWYASSHQLKTAMDAYGQCSIAQKRNQFKIAQQSCNRALHLVEGIRFLHRAETKQLKGSILQILQSEKLRQGLAGNQLIDGKYLSKDQIKAVQELEHNIQEADNLFSAKKWSEAFQLYDALFSTIEKATSVNDQVREKIGANRLIARFRMFYDPAQLLMHKGQWQKAIDLLLQAQKILISMPEKDRKTYSIQLQDKLQKSQFASLKSQGDLFFSSANWQSAITAYNQALSKGRGAALSPASIEAIKNNIKQAQVYTIIDKGNKAFTAGSWDEAIDAYTRASKILSGGKNLSLESSPNINIQKLARIILQASIIRDRQAAETHLAKNELEKAKLAYRHILAAIGQSDFKKEEEFSKISAKTGRSLKELDKKIYLNVKEDYLRGHYQKLFAANYPSSIPKNLIKPLVSYSRQKGSKRIFRMQCTEIGSRSHTLVMFYAYDQKTGQWSLYSEN